MLVDQGIVTRADDPSHNQKALNRLTARGISLLPILAQIGMWSRQYLPVSDELDATATELERGGQPLWDRLMAELRTAHLKRA